MHWTTMNTICFFIYSLLPLEGCTSTENILNINQEHEFKFLEPIFSKILKYIYNFKLF